MSIGKVTVGGKTAGNAHYFEASVAHSAEDYYSGSGEAAGRWMGRGTTILGATEGDQVPHEAAAALLERLEGPDGEEMGTRPGTRRDRADVTAYDLTFSTPKSVSVLFALGPPEIVAQVVAAHEAAIKAALGYLEDRAAYWRGAHGWSTHDAPGGFVAIAYQHRTSRALDPQLHTHVAAANRTLCPDGRWRALDGRALYNHAKSAGMLYQAGLRAELSERLGVAWAEVSPHGQADVVGVPQALIDSWSSRAAEVGTALANWTSEFEAREGREPTSAERGRAAKSQVLVTRTAKDPCAAHTDEELRDGWALEARGWGHEPDDVVGAALNRHVVEAARPIVDVAEILAELTQDRATFARSDIVKAVARRAGGDWGRSAADVRTAVEAQVDRVLGAVDIIAIDPISARTASEGTEVINRSSDGRPVWVTPAAVRFTTEAVLDGEARILAWAGRSDDQRCVVAVQDDVLADLDEHQAAAVRGILGDGAAVSVLVGPAGAGKSRSLAAATSAWEQDGVHVMGCAPSAKAAAVLHDEAGCRAETLTKLLWEHHRPDGPSADFRLRPGSVVLVDEAAMASSHDLDELRALTQAAEAKVVLVGDHRQLGAVGAGGMFALLAQHPDGPPRYELGAVRRMREQWERHASLGLRTGDPEAVAAYHEHGRLHRGGDEAEAVAAVAAEVVRGREVGQEVLAMAPRRSQVQAINDAVRSGLREVGLLDSGTSVTVGGQSWMAGEALITTRNDRRMITSDGSWIANGDRWTVIGAEAGGLAVVGSDGRRAILPQQYVDAHVQPAYALTVHKAQGSTVERGVLLVDETTSASALYVGLTRGTEGNDAFVVDSPAPEMGPADEVDPAALVAEISQRSDPGGQAAHWWFEQADERVKQVGEGARRAVAAAEAIRIDRPRFLGQDRDELLDHRDRLYGLLPDDFGSAEARALTREARYLEQRLGDLPDETEPEEPSLADLRRWQPERNVQDVGIDR